MHVVDRPGAPQSTIAVGLPTIDPSQEDFVALQVTNALLGGSFASRITANIREDKGYTYSPMQPGLDPLPGRHVAGDGRRHHGRHRRLAGRDLLRDPAAAGRAAVRGGAALGIQNYLAGIFVLQNSSRGGIVGQLAYMRLHDLPDDYLETYVDRIYDVTPEEVQRIMRDYIRAEDMLLVVTGDREQVEQQLVEFGTPIVD